MIRETELKACSQDLYCDKCYENGKEVKMVWNGVGLTSCPMQYAHNCPECDHTEVKYDSYPKVIYK